MTKTIKDIAKEFDVSEQYVRRLINKLPAESKPTKQGVSWVIDKKSYKVISNKLNGKRNKGETSFERMPQTSDPTVTKLLETVSRQQDTIDKMTQALDQEQKLHLLSEQRVEKLEAQLALPENAKKDLLESSKGSWWGRIFKHS